MKTGKQCRINKTLYMNRVMRKPVSGCSDEVQHLTTEDRVLQLRSLVVEELFYLCSNNKCAYKQCSTAHLACAFLLAFVNSKCFQGVANMFPCVAL